MATRAKSTTKVEKARVYSDCSSMVIVRQKMDVNSDKVCRIPVETIVKAKKENGDWSQVYLEDGKGYVMNHFLVYGE